MRIAITASGPSLDDRVEPRFGRCPYFLLIDSDTLQSESMPNPNIYLGGGAGPQSAQLMSQKGVSVVLTGNCGPNAFQTFGAAGIQVITGVGGKVREAVEKFKSGQLRYASSPTVKNHFGMGMGGGRGMGRMMVDEPSAAADEVARLQQTVNDLRGQLDAIQNQIGSLVQKHTQNL